MPSEPFGAGSAVQPPEFYLNQAASVGVPEEFIREFLAYNPGDYHRILEVWQPEATPEQRALSASVALPSQKQISQVRNGTSGGVVGGVPVPRVDITGVESFNASSSGSRRLQQTGRSPASVGAGMVGRVRQALPSSRALSARTRLVAKSRGRTTRPRNLDALAVSGGITASASHALLRQRLRRNF